MRIECRSTCVWCNRAIEDATWLVDHQDGRWHTDCANEVLTAAYQHRHAQNLQTGAYPGTEADHAPGAGQEMEGSPASPSAPVADGEAAPGAAGPGLVAIKRCSKCGRGYPATPEYFHRSHGKLKPYCKLCAIQYWHEYYSRKGKANAGPGHGSPPEEPEPSAPPASAALGEPGRRITPEVCRNRREALKMTQEALARRADVGDTALERFEAGRACLSEAALRRLDKALVAAVAEGPSLG